MLLAEEFDFLRNKQVLRIMLALSLKGGLTRTEIIKLGLGKPYRIKEILSYLVDEGKLVKVKRVVKKKPRTPPDTFYHYFMADEFLAAALAELCELLKRTHLSYASGFERLSWDLKPLI